MSKTNRKIPNDDLGARLGRPITRTSRVSKPPRGVIRVPIGKLSRTSVVPKSLESNPLFNAIHRPKVHQKQLNDAKQVDRRKILSKESTINIPKEPRVSDIESRISKGKNQPKKISNVSEFNTPSLRGQSRPKQSVPAAKSQQQSKQQNQKRNSESNNGSKHDRVRSTLDDARIKRNNLVVNSIRTQEPQYLDESDQLHQEQEQQQQQQQQTQQQRQQQQPQQQQVYNPYPLGPATYVSTLPPNTIHTGTISAPTSIYTPPQAEPLAYSFRFAAKPPIVQIRNLAPGTTAEDVSTVVESIGTVGQCRTRDINDAVMAEIYFENGDDAQRTVAQFNNSYADGRLITAGILREFSIPEYVASIKPVARPPYVNTWEGPPLYSDNLRK